MDNDIVSVKIRQLETQWSELNNKKEDELKRIGKANKDLFKMVERGYDGKLKNILTEIVIIEESKDNL